MVFKRLSWEDCMWFVEMIRRTDTAAMCEDQWMYTPGGSPVSWGLSGLRAG